MSTFWSDNLPKLGQMFAAIAIFLAVLAVIFFVAGRANGKKQRPLAIFVFLGPAVLLLVFGLLGPAIRTFLLSFKGSASQTWVGFANYKWLFTDESERIVLRNTVFWILFTPIITTGLGLLLAVLLDRMRRESVAKSLIFMPMAISFVGASITWSFVYKYANVNQPQIGLMSSLAKHLGFTEASALDGATGWRLFRGVTFPMVRSTFIVVLATMVVATLKLFDIVRAATGGNFGTSVLANEMYSEVFIRYDAGRGAAMAIVLFLLVVPVLAYNIINLRRERSIS